MSECKFKHTDRTGLYIMVFLLLTLGPCSQLDMGKDITQTKIAVSGIEDSIGCFKCHMEIFTKPHPTIASNNVGRP